MSQEGDYYISAGGFTSRQFVIYKKAYDICNRVMLEYFTYQRCGHPLGWNGACHLEDGYVRETCERVDLSGGYHQSCDLRKSPGGVSIGVLSMLNFALRDESEWGKILVRDEVKWACDYFVKTIQENGAMYNTLNAPFGWEPRIFYKSPAPSSAQWNVTSILALGYMYLKDTYKDSAIKYLDTALRSYKYMMGNERSSAPYTHPFKEPLGMDPEFFYDQCFKGSSADLAYQITVTANLYRATKEERLLSRIKNILPSFLECISDGFVLMRRENPNKTVTSSCSYSWLMGGLLALCDCYELLGDVNGLEEKLRLALDEICTFMDVSIWKIATRPLTKADLDTPVAFENTTLGQSIKCINDYKGYFYNGYEVFEPSYACYIGIFLAKGALLLNESKYMEYAQMIADNLLGANRLDSSHIRAIGYNQPQHISYGQFFPSTPFIPGAVGVGYSDLDVYKISSEFDMPCVGLSMYLLSLLQ